MRSWLLVLCLFPLVACPPVRNGDDDDASVDDDDATDGGSVEALYAGLGQGQCLAVWDTAESGFLTSGQGYATTGLWYAIDCADEAGGSLTWALSTLNPEPGSSPVDNVSARSPDGSSAVSQFVDPAEIHIEEGDWSSIGGWWEGDAELATADGTSVRMTTFVFREISVQSVVGR